LAWKEWAWGPRTGLWMGVELREAVLVASTTRVVIKRKEHKPRLVWFWWVEVTGDTYSCVCICACMHLLVWVHAFFYVRVCVCVRACFQSCELVIFVRGLCCTCTLSVCVSSEITCACVCVCVRECSLVGAKNNYTVSKRTCWLGRIGATNLLVFVNHSHCAHVRSDKRN
jgi:hypothetical protein